MKKKPPIRQVEKLPEEAILNEVIFNKSNEHFYIGVENNKEEVKENGSNLEKAGLRN